MNAYRKVQFRGACSSDADSKWGCKEHTQAVPAYMEMDQGMRMAARRDCSIRWEAPSRVRSNVKQRSTRP
jgi:hypothetical protein